MMRITLVLFYLFFAQTTFSQNFKLVWSDEFNGVGLPDNEKWGYEDGYIRNNELQYYTRNTKNVRQHNGNLEITVCRESMNGFDYTSASIISLHKAQWRYGKIEGRFKIPNGKGLWGCFWTLGANFPEIGWPQCGEIDIFEHINSESNIHGTAHWADSTGKHTMKGAEIKDINVEQWHNYSIEWTPNSIKWFVDTVQYHEVAIKDGINSTTEFHSPQYILVNLPIGGNWPGSPDSTTLIPATMYCDYIRVYQMETKK